MAETTGSCKACELFESGHRACGGCGAALAARLVTKAAGTNTIVVSSTGCMEVFSTPYPETAWKVPWIHSLFENAAAVASGIEASLKKQGRSEKVVIMAGDGATFDIGMISISGAFERGHDFTYVCYDNEAYMNTGIQRSSATPWGAWTTTTPSSHPQDRPKKDMLAIMAAHRIPYAATASVAYPVDLLHKVEKARHLQGTRFLHILSPCPPGWKTNDEESIELARMAVKARVFPLLEVENGEKWRFTEEHPGDPVEPYIRRQGRFRHLDAAAVAAIQEEVNARWERIKRRVEHGT